MTFKRLSDIPRAKDLNWKSCCATCKFAPFFKKDSRYVCNRYPPKETGVEVAVDPDHRCFEYQIRGHESWERDLTRDRDRVVRFYYHNLWQAHWNKFCGWKFWKKHPRWGLPIEFKEPADCFDNYNWRIRFDFSILVNEHIEVWDYEEALVKCSDSTIRKVEMFKQAILQNTVPNAEAFSD